MFSKLFKNFIGQDGQTTYRPSPVMTCHLMVDKLAFCANCTQMHEGVDPDAYRVYCDSCGKHEVFGHFSFNLIA